MDWADLPPVRRKALKAVLEADHLSFTRYFYHAVNGSPFLVGPHHRVMGRAIDRVFDGEIDRLMINVPPGYTKTEECVIALIARGMAKTKGRAKFIHASFSGELVNENSTRTKDAMGTDAYQGMWPIVLRADASGKGRWLTPEGGGLLAKPAGGPITGFRAGRMEPGFTGCLVIDDPLKPDDIFKASVRTNINRRWHTTFKSRLATERVPVIIIMQRLHDDDLCGYLLRGGGHCKWHHLLLPALVDNSKPYPAQFTHGIPIEHGLADGPLWEAKHNLADLEILQSDSFTWSSQYQQVPIVLGGNLFKEEWMQRSWTEESPPSSSWRAIFADTAQKIGEANDFSVFQCWGAGRNGAAVLYDQVRGKFEAPELLTVARAFWMKHAAKPVNHYGVLRGMFVEDKVSGTGLIQQIRRDQTAPIPIFPIARGVDKNKFQRAQDAIPYWAAGLVELPADAPWVAEFIREHLIFTGLGDTHDDQVDPAVDAIVSIHGGAMPAYGAWN